MAKLRKFTLGFNEKREKWELKEDKASQVFKSFKTKENATKGGVLKKILGPEGGSVKIKKLNERFQEERTYPKSKDPRKSKG